MTAILVGILLAGTEIVAGRPSLALELAPPTVYSTRGLPLVFRAVGSRDVYFRRSAVRLEILAPGGAKLRYECTDKRSISDVLDYVSLHPGETASRTLDVSCYHPASGTKYTITAVFDDGLDDFRGQAPGDAVWVTGPVRSNSIATQLGGPHNKALQTDGASRRR